MTTAPAPTAHVTSPAQDRFWIADRLETSGLACTVAMVLRFDGVLRDELLSAVLDAAIAQHTALRTSFGSLNDHPVKVVHPTAAAVADVMVLLRAQDELTGEPDARRG